tara:strand:+ start:1681 stop:2103 length:423 start_codon:yes stop_codon:yes gene_type:complete
MAWPSISPKRIKKKSILTRLSLWFFSFTKNKEIENNFNISAEMKSYRKQAQQKLLDSHYVSSELFETVMEAFDDIEFENLDTQPVPSYQNKEEVTDMVKDGEFTLIFSKKKRTKNQKTKSSKNSKSSGDIRQQPLPNIVG